MMARRTPLKTGSLVCPTAKTTQMFIEHPDALAPHWVDRLSRDSSQLGELQIEIRDQIRRFAEQMTLSVLSEAALPGADLERREKRAFSPPSLNWVLQESGDRDWRG